MSKPWVRAVAIAGGYCLALWAAGALVELRHRGVDPADIAASPGMWAFGDLMSFLVVAGVLCVLPTYFLLRMLRGVDQLWTTLSWACAGWGALAPLAVVSFRLISLPPPLAPGAARPILSPWQSAALVVSAMALLRMFVSPGSLGFLVLAWRMSLSPPARRRMLWAAALEACAMIPLAGWMISAMLGNVRGR
jgi:hypothetical protein